VHAWLAKPLDWCVIQLARRCVSSEPGVVDPVDASDIAEWKHRLNAATAREARHLSLTPEGTFQFDSPVQTAARESDIVYGRFFPAAREWRQCPTAILLHGWNAEWCYRRLFPVLAARLNHVRVNAAIFELPYHMRRRPQQGRVRDFISSDLHRMLDATRQAVADIRALLGWFRTEGCPAVGLWGFSLGAWLAGLTVRTEPLLHCAVLATPITRIDRVIMELPFCAPVRHSLSQGEVDLREMNLASGPPRIEPRRILLVQSRHDLFAPAETVEEVWQAWGQPHIWRLPHGHISLLMSRTTMKRTVAWIAANI
jgi:pimeloyl-ACP methyl ester carboxylesterase